jgi:hypothetical protein
MATHRRGRFSGLSLEHFHFYYALESIAKCGFTFTPILRKSRDGIGYLVYT